MLFRSLSEGRAQRWIFLIDHFVHWRYRSIDWLRGIHDIDGRVHHVNKTMLRLWSDVKHFRDGPSRWVVDSFLLSNSMPTINGAAVRRERSSVFTDLRSNDGRERRSTARMNDTNCTGTRAWCGEDRLILNHDTSRDVWQWSAVSRNSVTLAIDLMEGSMA